MPVSLLLQPSRWSLRTRLLAVLVSLLALVCLAVGVATTVALQHFLLGRLDVHFVAAGGRSAGAGRHAPDGAQPRPYDGDGDGADVGARFLLAPGQPAGTLGARITGDQVTAVGVLTESGGLRVLPEAAAGPLTTLPADGRPRTRDVRGLGEVRLIAARAPDHPEARWFALRDPRQRVSHPTQKVTSPTMRGFVFGPARRRRTRRPGSRPSP